MFNHVFVECAGCGSDVSRCELAEHHMRCEAIAAALRDEDELLHAVGKFPTSQSTFRIQLWNSLHLSKGFFF